MMAITVEQIRRGPISLRRFALPAKLPSSHSSTTPISAVCAMLSARIITGICYSNMLMEGRCLITSSPMAN